MKRSKYSLSHYKLATMSMGELVPVACYEVLPGDSIQQASSMLVRVSPLLAPVMHPVSVRIHHWFVPHRLVWDRWEDFITGGNNGSGDGAVFPTLALPAGLAVGSLPDYLGIPHGLANPITVSALPFRSYNLVYNEFYRDADLAVEAGPDDYGLKRIAWEKDYFTAARPWPQKGPAVTLPLGTRAPISGLGAENQTYNLVNQAVIDGAAGAVNYPASKWINTVAPDRFAVRGTGPAGGFPDVYADLTNATAVNINDVRKAFALQRYQEARAQYGSRYTEYLRYLGVRSSDARLQRPEYLGGGKATVSFSEVLQTGPGSDTDESVVGELKGHGIAALRSRRFRRFFEEHGLVLSLMSVRPRAMYTHGVSRMWARRTKEDYWQKELELIGQQQVHLGEIYADVLPADQVAAFGYSNRYDEYRHLWSSVSGEFRTTLNFWHMAREFSAAPVLNQSFVDCDPTTRIHSVTDPTVDKLWCMINHSIQARRMLTKHTIGRVL